MEASRYLDIHVHLNFLMVFFDQTGEIWSHDGDLLATTSQFVYYKE